MTKITQPPKSYNPENEPGQAFQGDVVFFALPKEFTLIKPRTISEQAGRITLAEGEGSGHIHCIWTQPTYFRPDDMPASKVSQMGIATMHRDKTLLRYLIQEGLLTTDKLVIGFLEIKQGPVVIQHTNEKGVLTGEHDNLTLYPALYYVGMQQEFDFSTEEMHYVYD